MNKNAMGLVIGAGVVLAGYFALKAIKGASGAPASIRATNPGGGWTAGAPGEYLSVDQLIYGAATGSPYDTIPTTNDLIRNAAYGGKLPTGIKVGYW